MEPLLTAIVVGGALALVVWPFFRTEPEPDAVAERRAVLEQAKLVKYREIRDIELDHRAGKIEHDDWQRLDAELRREALAVLTELDDDARLGRMAAASQPQPRAGE